MQKEREEKNNNVMVHCTSSKKQIEMLKKTDI